MRLNEAASAPQTMLAGFTRDANVIPAGAFPPRQPRHPVRMPVRLRADAHLLNLICIDISRGGAKLALSPDINRSALVKGSFVQLNGEGFALPKLSTIAWINKHEIGLRFNLALDAADLESLGSRYEAFAPPVPMARS